MVPPSRHFFAAHAFVLSLVASSLYADPTTVESRVERLFDIGWSDAYESRAAVDLEYDRVVKSVPADSRVDFAYALIKMRQRQYPVAADAIKRVVARDEADLDAWTTKIWLAVIMKKYEAVLGDIERVSQLLSDKEREFDANDRLAMAKFLGRVIGFLEGPAAESINAALVARQRGALVAQLPADESRAFQADYDAVRATFQDLTQNEAEAADEDRAAAERQREGKLQDLAEERERNDERRDVLEEDRKRVRSELGDQLSEFAKSERELLSQYATLERQAAVIESELFAVGRETTRLEAILEQQQDPIAANQLQREIARLDLLARRYQTDLLGVQRQASVVSAQRTELNLRRAETQRSFGTQFDQLNKDLSQLDERDRKTQAQEKRSRRPPVASSRRARALAAEATAFTTYEPYPLEQQKQRILGLFQ